jgi:plastocyanin
MTKLNALTFAAFSLGFGTAFAHGDEEHAAPRTFDARKVEPTDFGQEGNPKKVTKTIKVDMTDTMRFTPSDVTVKRGETVKFVVHNDGKVLHEMVLGTKEAIAEHAELMKRLPEMGHADVPGMPPGSPGMEVGARQDPYHVFLIDKSGRETVFASYPKA